MATTNPELALTALEILSQCGIEFAMLHGRERLLQGEVSDVDLVVGIEPDEIIATTKEAFASRGLFPIVVTRYDLAGTRGAWYSSEDGSDAVQLDFLYDVEGLGRQGLRSSGLLEYSTTAAIPPEIESAAQIIYLWRKRQSKDQADRLPELRSSAEMLPVASLVDASVAVTGSSRTAFEIIGKKPHPPWVETWRHPALRLQRIARRLYSPVGYWVQTPSRDMAELLAARFGHFLPHAEVGEAPTSPSSYSWWYWQSIQPVRLRPGVFFSFGQAKTGPAPDLTISEDTDVENAARSCILSMSARF